MFYFGLIIIAAFAIRDLLSQRERTRRIRQYAETASLTYIGGGLPKSFPIGKTSVSWASSIMNAVAGEKNGRELVVFDCRWGVSKGRRPVTIVAIRGPVENFASARLDPRLTITTVDEWTLISRARSFFSFHGVLSLAEIEALIAEL